MNPIAIVFVALGSFSLSPYAATLYHCTNYGGGTFWSTAPCRTQNAVMDRMVTVPENMPFNQQVEIANQVRAKAEALYRRPSQYQQAPAQHIQVQRRGVDCGSIAKEISNLDSLARQPQSGPMQDWISKRRKELRDTQYRNRC